MGKNKQIEEMAKLIHIATDLYYIECIKVATYLFEKDNCRIIDKDRVVISKEEYESLLKIKEQASIKDLNYFSNLRKLQRELEQVEKERDSAIDNCDRKSKEMAEKIILSEIATIKNIRDACVLPTPKYREGYIDCCNGILFYLKNNISKQFGVEIKE